jgi:hypothetical protein
VERLFRLIALALVTAPILACTSLAPGAEQVKITTDAKDVQGCKIITQVSANGPFNGPNDWKNQLKNATLAVGGNVVFRTGPLAFTRHVDGIAYLCQQPPIPAH